MLNIIAKHTHSSVFLFLALFLNLTFLASFGGNQYALAQYSGPDPRYPAPAGQGWIRFTSDYPTDDEIKDSFLGTERDQTLLTTMPGLYLQFYGAFCKDPFLKLKCAPSAWPSGFLLRNGRSERWAADFFDRYNRYYMSRAKRYVYVITDFGLRPRDCPYFYDVIDPTLKLNENVMRIYLVFPGLWTVKTLYWDRKRAERGNGGNGDDSTRILTPNPAALPYVIPLIGAGTAAISAWLNAQDRTIKGLRPNPLDPQSIPGDGKDQDPAVDRLKFPLDTDVLPSTEALLPSSSNDKADTNGEVLLSSTDGSSGPQTGETSSETSRTESASGATSAIDTTTDDTFKTGDQMAYNEDIAVRNLIRRRRRALFPRQSNSCSVRPTASDFLPDDPYPNTTPPAQDSYVLAHLGVNADTATILITQHDKQPGNDYFLLDLSVFDDPEAEPVSDNKDVQASPGKEVKIEIPWQVDDPPPDSLITMATYTWPLFVYVDSDREKPIRFEYGDPLMIASGNDWSGDFNSDDPSHCSSSLWIDSVRTIRCTVSVEHVKLPQINPP